MLSLSHPGFAFANVFACVFPDVFAHIFVPVDHRGSQVSQTNAVNSEQAVATKAS